MFVLVFPQHPSLTASINTTGAGDSASLRPKLTATVELVIGRALTPEPLSVGAVFESREAHQYNQESHRLIPLGKE